MAMIGIDLGTTNSLAVAYLEDHYVMIPNRYQEYLTPSVVSVDDDGSMIVGKTAKQRLVTHPQATASLFKRSMGKDIEITLNKTKYLPEQLSALIVKQLIEDAKEFLDEEIDEVVISVPAYFNEHQRNATKRIGDLIGVKIERLVNEPSAAAIAVHQGCQEDEAFIVFDFGGGTLDVSIVDCFDNVVSICAIAGDNHLGGSDFDNVIAKDFCNQHKIDYPSLSKKQKESLLLQCEAVKMALQDKHEVNVKLHFNHLEYDYVLNNEHFKQISMDVFSRIQKVIADALNSSGFEKGEIDKMVLVGGSCHMPVVVDFLKSLMNLEVYEEQDMDQMVVKGLGTYIGIKQRKEAVRQLVLTDICPFSLSTGIHNSQEPSKPLASILIPRNSVLPTSKTQRFYTVEKGQTTMDISVYQGESMYASFNDRLAQYFIDIPKNKEAYEGVEVTFSYDINSLLCVDIKVLSTNEQFQYYVGGDKVDQKYIDAIKRTSMKLNLEPELDYILERVNRILEEAPLQQKDAIQKLYLDFQKQIQATNNNLRKKSTLIDKMKIILDKVEKDFYSCDFFNLEDDESNEGGLLS